MSRPAASIILPTFNRLGYLRAAIDSVFAQTFDDWELIVADDGSEAQTTAYLARVAERPRTRLLRLAHRGNPAAVRNAALRAARGEFIAFLDSDDVWLPQKLERQLAMQRKRASCRWSYTAEDLIDASGRVLPRRRGWPAALHEGFIFEQLLTLEAGVSMPCVVAERRLIEEAGGFDEGLPYFEDYDLWLRLSLRSDVAALNQPLALVRNHAEHYSADRTGVYAARLKLLDKIDALDAARRQVIRLPLILVQERAKTSMALARVHAAAGRRREALSTLWQSRRLARRSIAWWSGAIHTLGLLGAPRRLRASVHRFRMGLQAP